MSEKSFAKKIDAKLVKNSGRNFKKGDMTKELFVIDLKEVGKSFTINNQVWNKISADAANHGWDKIPMLILSFKGGNDLIVMSYQDFEGMMFDDE